MNHEIPDIQAGFRKDRGTRDQIANICWIIEKARKFQKNGCESWTIKKAVSQRIDAFELVLEKTLESSLDSKEIKPVNPKGNQP